MRLTTAGIPRDFETSIVGPVTLCDVPPSLRAGKIRLFIEAQKPTPELVDGYLAVISVEEVPSTTSIARIERLRDFDHFRESDIVVLEPKSGFVRSLYRPAEKHHSLFITERCNRREAVRHFPRAH
jgi:hypothetical protein